MNNVLAKSNYLIHPFTERDRQTLANYGFETHGAHDLGIRVGTARFFVHTAAIGRIGEQRTRKVFTLAAYQDLTVDDDATASFTASNLTEVLELIDVLTKFWGVS